MSLHIEIGDDFVITSNSREFVLNKKQDSEERPFLSIGHYTSLKTLFEGLVTKSILRSDCTSLTELDEHITSLNDNITKIFKLRFNRED